MSADKNTSGQRKEEAKKSEPKRTLMHNLGLFIGHIVKGVCSDPSRKKIIRKNVEEEKRGTTTLRRTTIEEVEFKVPDSNESKQSR